MLNTHLDHKDSRVQLESVKLRVGRLKEIEGDTLTVLATNDSHMRPEHELFAPIKVYMDHTHLSASKIDLTETTSGEDSEPKSKIIDYIFYRNTIPLSYRVITGDYGVPYISDHYPILRTLDY